MFWLSIRFFSSLLHFFSLGEIKVCGLLSLFPLFLLGRSENTSVCLSLSLLRRERFGKPDLPIEYSAAHAERAIIIFEKEEIDSSDKLARESRKKKMDWISSHCGTRTPQPQSRRVKDENAYIREQICACVLPSVRPRGACLQNSFFLRCFTIYICVCVYILCKDLSLINNAFVIYICAVLCSNTHEDKL